MALLEFLDDKPARPPIQIFATDLRDTVSLQKARDRAVSREHRGRGLARAAAPLLPEGGRPIPHQQGLAGNVVFARQNVAADPPFSRVDLDQLPQPADLPRARTLQKRVIPTFHYALNPGGFLLLGRRKRSATTPTCSRVVDQPHRIYTRKSTRAPRSYPHFRADDAQAARPGGQRSVRAGARPAGRLAAGGRPRGRRAIRAARRADRRRTSTSSSSAARPVPSWRRPRASRATTC